MLQFSSPSIEQYYAYVSSVLSPYLQGSLVGPLSLLISLLVFTVILSVVLSAFAYTFGWVERKLIARIQARRGPTYVGKYGFFQNLADLVKLLSKEDIHLARSDTAIFKSILPLLVSVFFLMLVLIPFNSFFVGIGSSIGLVVVFLLLSFTPPMVLLAGWSSGNKFGFISSQRSIVMLLSYEIPLIIVIATIAMVSHSFSFFSIVGAQKSVWFAALMPVGFLIFFIVMLAELERPPFDIREADSELIAGWMTDMGSPYYAIALLLDYMRVFVGSLLISLLFLGGWNGPFLPPFAWIALKVVFVALLVVVIRASTVRMRLDKLLKLGWGYLLPLAILNFMAYFFLFVK